MTLIERYNLSTASLIVVVSEALKESLVAQGIDAKKILVNPNGIDPEKYSPQISGEKIRNKYNLEDKTIIGFIGTFHLWHGVLVMAQAIVRFLENYPMYRDRVKFLIIGDGVLMPQFQDIISQSPYSDRIILTGFVPQAEGPNYLAACDILLSPHVPNPDGSKFFGSPTKLFEYMGLGKAIIASDLDQIGDILQHQITAYLVEPGDIIDLSDAMATLTNDKSLREKLGQEACEEVMNYYTWDYHVRKILDQFEVRNS